MSATVLEGNTENGSRLTLWDLGAHCDRQGAIKTDCPSAFHLKIAGLRQEPASFLGREACY